MFYHIWKMFQMTAKGLLRSRGFLFFVVIVPFMATLILNVKNTGDVITEAGAVTDLTKLDAKVAYSNHYTMFSIKVYDSSRSELTKAFLEEISHAGMFQIYRVDTGNIGEKKIQESMKNTSLNDNVGAILYVGEGFSKELLDGKIRNSVTIYKSSDDSRFEMFTSTAKGLLERYALLGNGVHSENELLNKIEKNSIEVPALKQVELTGEKSFFNMDVDHEKTGTFGNAMAILTIAFVFSGIMILGTLLNEKRNLVYTRIMLTKAGDVTYLISKILIVLFTSLFQTCIAVISYTFLVKKDVGVSLLEFGIIVFLMGLLFNMVSVCIGIFVHSEMTASYLAFIVWTITALLGGMYFDISNASGIFRKVSMLMPQRWALKAAFMFMQGNAKAAYPMLFTATTAYITVIMVAGMIGLKLNRKE